MGNFLEDPIKDKLSEDQENEYFEVGVCSMQGWRNHMEDAHIAELNLQKSRDDGNIEAIFGVFDGHGGDTVSKFVSQQFISELLKKGDIESDTYNALKNNFLHMDKSILSEEGTEATFKFLNKGQQEDVQNFSVDNVDMEKVKMIIDDIETKYKSRQKSDAELAIMQEIEDLKTEIRELQQQGDNKEKFLNKVSQQQYLQKRAEFSPRAIGGTTSIVVQIKNNQIFCANSGDSRGVISKEGIAEPLSYDHKPSNPDEKARIEAAGGSVKENRVEGNLALSRAIGDFTQKESTLPCDQQMVIALPDIKQVCIDPSCEFMIIACDGIWDCLENQQIIDQQRTRIIEGKYNRLSEVVEEIFDSILAKNKEEFGNDNMTCIIVKFKKKQLTKYQSTIQDINELNQQLKTKQFLKYLLPSKEDFDNYEHLKQKSDIENIIKNYPNIMRWQYCLKNQSMQDKNHFLNNKPQLQTKSL